MKGAARIAATVVLVHGLAFGGARADDTFWWQPREPLTGADLHDVVTAHGVTVAVGDGVVLTSDDAQVWALAPAVNAALSAVAARGEGFVAVGQGVVLTSPDGLDWSSQPCPFDGTLRDVACGGGRCLAVGADVWLSSSDGTSWALHQHRAGPPSYLEYTGVAWTGHAFVVVGTRTGRFPCENNQVMRLTLDGETYTEEQPPAA